MPETPDEITENLSPRYRDESNETRMILEDGTTIVVGREIKRIHKENGNLIIQTAKDIGVDGLGNMIKDVEEIGGVCRCGVRVHKDFFHHCGRCGLPLCERCAHMRDEEAYCAWCHMWLSFFGIFRRRHKRNGE